MAGDSVLEIVTCDPFTATMGLRGRRQASGAFETAAPLMPDGTVVLELRRCWTDGTTHLVFDPVELLERLAALTPRPRINLVLYHGVLAPRAAWRRAVVPAGKEAGGPAGCDPCAGGTDGTLPPRLPNGTWDELMQRSCGFDVLACPRCAGRLKLVALVQDGAVIQRIR